VDGLCTVAGYAGRELAPHVKKHGGKLIPESLKKDRDGRSNIDGAMVVAASGVQGEVNHLTQKLCYCLLLLVTYTYFTHCLFMFCQTLSFQSN